MIDQASVDALTELMTWISEQEDSWREAIPFVQIQYRFAHGGYWTISLDGQTACVAAGGWTLLRLLSNQLLKEQVTGARDELAQKAISLSNILRRTRAEALPLGSTWEPRLWVLFEVIQRDIQAVERQHRALGSKTPSSAPNSQFYHRTELVLDIVCIGETGSDGMRLSFLKPNLLTLNLPNGFKHTNPMQGPLEFLRHAAAEFAQTDTYPTTLEESYYQSLGCILEHAFKSASEWKMRPSV